MSMHNIPLTDIEREGLKNHGLGRNIGKPSQLADCFRQGVKWGQDQEMSRLHAENTALHAEILELRNLKIRPPLSDLGLAGLGVKYFGNPIPQGWYKAARALEAAHGILWTAR